MNDLFMVWFFSSYFPQKKSVFPCNDDKYWFLIICSLWKQKTMCLQWWGLNDKKRTTRVNVCELLYLSLKILRWVCRVNEVCVGFRRLLHCSGNKYFFGCNIYYLDLFFCFLRVNRWLWYYLVHISSYFVILQVKLKCSNSVNLDLVKT